MSAPRSKYVVHKLHIRESESIVWIIDLDEDGTRSVTNDAEQVCRELHARFPDHRIIYRDSMGEWGELVHLQGILTGYAPAGDMAPD